MPDYKVRYKDGRTQKVTADSTRTTKEFIYFEKNGTWVHQVAASEVEGVGYDSVPDPEVPEVEVSEVKRSGRVHGF